MGLEINMKLTEDWVTLATAPPSSSEQLDEIAGALGNRGVEIQLEENPMRQCDKDVAIWLRVHTKDLSLAWDLARKLIS
jgi:hypothetical protein